MSSEKLYYADSYIKEFEAKIISCEKSEKGYAVILDKTAFFPEGGGQQADTGYIDGVRVIDAQEKNGEIIHYCKSEIEVGKICVCSIDWNQRFVRMQNHSGEHIVSGIVHSLYGYDNVGFHMEEDYMTVDFSGELTREQLDEVEDKANEAVYNNIDIVCYMPSSDELADLDYRSKLELIENVRLVKIGDVDLCACCAPHVGRSGEIGLIKILDFMRHRGGIRITMKCGFTALKDYREKYKSVSEISNLLSAKQELVSAATERLLNEKENTDKEFSVFRQNVARSNISNFVFINDVSYMITSYYDADMMRETVNKGMTQSLLSVVFSGNDENGYSYIAGSNTLQMGKVAKKINSALNGRGGGRATMIQGKVSADCNLIEAFLKGCTDFNEECL